MPPARGKAIGIIKGRCPAYSDAGPTASVDRTEPREAISLRSSSVLSGIVF